MRLDQYEINQSEKQKNTNRTTCGITSSTAACVLWKSPKGRTQEGKKNKKTFQTLWIACRKITEPTPRHIILKVLKDGELFGSIRKKWHFMHRQTTERLMIGFSLDIREVKVSEIFCTHRKNKNCQLIILHSAKVSFTNEGKWKHF